MGSVAAQGSNWNVSALTVATAMYYASTQFLRLIESSGT